MRDIERVVEDVVRVLSTEGVAQVPGYVPFRYLRRSGQSVVLQRRNGKEARVPFEVLGKAIRAIRGDHSVYIAGPGRLREFGIKPAKWWTAAGTVRGYQLEDFQEAFQRYLTKTSPIPLARSPEPNSDAGLRENPVAINHTRMATGNPANPSEPLSNGDMATGNGGTPGASKIPTLAAGSIRDEWLDRVVALERDGMARVDAEVWAAEKLGLLPVVGERS